jgi:dTDP-4-amino-4,6-dideoxygalactose transaminase
MSLDDGEPDPAKEYCQLHQPWLGEEEEQEVLETLRSGWLTTGRRTHQFERDFADFIGCKHAIGLNSCTAGLHLALAAADIGPGDEVITTAITFAATANVIVHQGARPVFIDVEKGTLNIDADQIERAISEKTKALMPVHLFGHPCDMDMILKVAQKHHLLLIEDAAHAVGSEYRGRRVGSIGDLTSFSFYATKKMTTGEGGMLTTDNDEFAEKVRILSLHGITADAWHRHGGGDYVHWDVLYPGYKYNMFDIQAALGIHQLRKLEMFWQCRKRWVDMYDKAFIEIPEIELLAQKQNVKHAHHLYPILVRVEDLTVDRDRILHALKEAGVGVSVHFRALPLMSYYAGKFGFKRGDFPVAEEASDRLISLPLFPKMTEENVRWVIGKVKDVIFRHQRRKTFMLA